MRKIKRNDEVVVITGRDKGKRGDVIRVLDDGRALVSGVNIVKKHTKPNPYANEPGGIKEKEAPIQLSNLAIWNADEARADRVGIREEDGKNVRFFKSTGKTIES
ncbi:MAG: 50S ribosomal protein L24 [Pseudomonadales bacterium]|jgi:large subunit ribosomal protein L24|nr:50S ribosomal protein L24 [Pseudomonadales bacterium]MEE2891468.1 50S ribosomal protein L24 [Pseudomonadota bacterium]